MIVPSGCCDMIGQVVGVGRPEKPSMKEGNTCHMFHVKKSCWPKFLFICGEGRADLTSSFAHYDQSIPQVYLRCISSTGQAAKKKRLLIKAQGNTARKEAETTKKPIVVKYGQIDASHQ